MKWDIFEILGLIGDALNTFGSNSSLSDLNYDEKSKINKKTKYFTEKVSLLFLLISAVLSFFVFKDPLLSENYVQILVVASLIGLAISFSLFFILYTLEKYYFKSVIQWLFFSFSTILMAISVVLCVYLKSGIFI